MITHRIFDVDHDSDSRTRFLVELANLGNVLEYVPAQMLLNEQHAAHRAASRA